MSRPAPAAPSLPADAASPSKLYLAEEGCLLLFSAAISLSISAMEISFLLALALRLWRWLRGEAPSAPQLYVWSGVLLLASWLLASAAAPDPALSFPRVLRLYQLLVVPIVLEHATQTRSAVRLLAVYAAGAAISSGIGLWGWGSRLTEVPAFRLESVFSNAMTSGNVFALAVAGLWTYCWRVGGGAVRWLAVALGVTTVALTATLTRSSWLGASMGALLGIGFARRRVWALAVLVLALGAASLLPGSRERAGVLADAGEYTARGRISLWLSGLETFAERPITGWGLSDHTALIRAHRRADATFEAGHYHSNPVQVGVATGVVGLLAYALFHGVIGILLWRRRGSPFALAGLAVWLAFHVAGFFDWSFGDAEVAYQYFWWIGLGLGAAPSR